MISARVHSLPEAPISWKSLSEQLVDPMCRAPRLRFQQLSLENDDIVDDHVVIMFDGARACRDPESDVSVDRNEGGIACAPRFTGKIDYVK